MATKTFEELKQMAIQIRDEKTNKQNTATRIGTQMLEHLNKLEQDYYDKTTLDKRVTELNISVLYPTLGVNGTNKYTLAGAIAQVSSEYRTVVGLKITFINNATSKPETWKYNGGTFTTTTNWVQGDGSGGNKTLEWAGDIASTRKQVLSQDRKKLLQISYTNADGEIVNEQYIGATFTDTEWAKDSNWEQIPNQLQLSNLDVRNLLSVEYLEYTQQNNKYVKDNGDIVSFGGLLLLTYNMPKSKKLYVKRNKIASYSNQSVYLVINDNGVKTKVTLKANETIEEIDLSAYSDNSEILINNGVGANDYVIVCGALDTLSFPEVIAKEVNFLSTQNSSRALVQPINLINPSEIENDTYYGAGGNKVSLASGRNGTIEIKVSFGKTYYIFGNAASGNAYNVIVDKKGTVLSSTQSRVILIDNVNAYSLRLSINPSVSEVGAFEGYDKFSPYVDNALFKNPVEVYGDKSATNLFNKYRVSTQNECLLNGAYNRQYNMSLARIPIERNKVYSIKVPASNYYNPKTYSELAILSEDNRVIDGSNKTIGQLSLNENMTACQYSVAETLNINGEVYSGNIYLAINTYFESAKLDIRDTLLVQEGENVTELSPMYYSPKYDVPLLMIRHCMFGDSISAGTNGNPSKIFASCFDNNMYSVVNKSMSGTPISYTLARLLEMDEEEMKSFNLFTIQHGTNCAMGANAESEATIPTETFADIPYTYGDNTQVNTIEEHLNRFGTDIFSTFCKCIEYIRYYNLRAKVILITVPEMTQRAMEETNVNIKKIAKLYGLDVIDAASYAGISRRTTKAYSADEIHFKDEYGNYQWFNYIGTELYNKMRGVLKPY